MPWEDAKGLLPGRAPPGRAAGRSPPGFGPAAGLPCAAAGFSAAGFAAPGLGAAEDAASSAFSAPLAFGAFSFSPAFAASAAPGFAAPGLAAPGFAAADFAASLPDVFLGVSPAGAGNSSRRRRATGASMVDEAERTNSPMSCSFCRTTLLGCPSSFASSWTRTFATILLSRSAREEGRGPLAPVGAHARVLIGCPWVLLPVPRDGGDGCL